ncbi:uncharacterized protein LOC118438579 [Folsomia candida]|uniref:uncharacterized protein LOC118438579 n=1 Tax=Folsomia candida TaxID=158441 RepID=UPI001604C710|nr:uncharacterized protein LOC118438579 [Folsomia candida]
MCNNSKHGALAVANFSHDLYCCRMGNNLLYIQSLEWRHLIHDSHILDWGDSSDIFFLVLGITSVILVPITALLWIGWRKEHLGCTKAWLYINCGLFAFDLLTTIFTGISVALIVRSVSTIIFLLVVYNYAKMLEEKQRVELSNPIPFNRMP